MIIHKIRAILELRNLNPFNVLLLSFVICYHIVIICIHLLPVNIYSE